MTTCECVKKEITRKSVEALLKSHNIERNSESWHDYEFAKSIVFKGEWFDGNYSEVIGWITDYLRI